MKSQLSNRECPPLGIGVWNFSGFWVLGFGILILFQNVCLAASFGRIVSWGPGQVLPANGPTNVLAISTAMDHSLALKADGTVFAWGNNMNGQSTVPPGLAGVIKIAAGEFFSVALRQNGSIVTWGANDYGQRELPAGLTGVKDISAGHGHCLALKSDGTVRAWGCNIFGQTNVPPGLNGVKAIFAVWNYSVALKSNGTVVAWGVNDAGQINIPSGLSNVIAIAGNNNYCVALTTNGTITMWGKYPFIRTPPNNVVAIAAGETHVLALTSTNRIIAWGDIPSGANPVPTGLANPFAISASWHYSAVLLRTGATLSPFVLTNPRWKTNSFSVSLPSQAGVNYWLEYKNALTNPSWTSLPAIAGNGSVLTLTNSSATAPRRLYRVRAQ
jgi:hypothetical protein